MEILVKEIETSLDAYEIFQIFSKQDRVMFLDSSRDVDGDGRYSILGINPYLELKGDESHYSENGQRYPVSIWERISELLKEKYSPNYTNLPMVSGCMGYISYEAGYELMGLKTVLDDNVFYPKVQFDFYDNFIIVDRLLKKTYLSSAGVLMPHEAGIRNLEGKIIQSELVISQGKESEKDTKNYHFIKLIINENGNHNQKINRAWLYKKLNHVVNSSLTANFTEKTYTRAISQLKDYILEGEIYIANLTQQLVGKSSMSGIEIFDILRRNSPADFGVFGKFDGFEIISSSPESFLKICKGFVETVPIKGTRPRGKEIEDDFRNKTELLESEKERAELLMIVDLERNDLSKVCKPFSVKVPKLYELTEHRTVFHLSAKVVGELKDELNAVDCVKACFPGGSITGTPKRRAMEIIRELEGRDRGIYTGCIGYFSLNGDAAFNIAIRTIVKHGDECMVGVGGGITCDSDESAEYLETFDKAVAMINSMRGVKC